MANFADETSLLNLLPRTYREADLDGSLQAFFSALDGVWSIIVTDMGEFDSKILTPSDSMLSYYLEHRGNPFEFPLSVEQQRLLVDGLFRIYQLRGSEEGLVHTINYLLGLQCTMQYDFEYSWRLGVSSLGIDTILLSEPKPTAHLSIPGELTPEVLTAVQAIVDFMKPHWLDVRCIGGAIIMPDNVMADVEYPASVLEVTGASSYTWSIINGEIVSGQGTRNIVFFASAPGTVTLEVEVVSWVDTITTRARATVWPSLDGVEIETDTYQEAGRLGSTAQLNNSTVLVLNWEGDNITIIGPTNRPNVVFDVGADGIYTELRAIVRDSNGSTATISKEIKVLDYAETHTHTTESLVVGTAEEFSLTLGEKWLVTEVVTDHPARVRIYNSAAHRASDAARAIGVEPTGDHGLLMEVVTTAELLSVPLSPWAYGETLLNVAYASIVNTGGEALPITATLSTIVKEA